VRFTEEEIGANVVARHSHGQASNKKAETKIDRGRNFKSFSEGLVRGETSTPMDDALGTRDEEKGQCGKAPILPRPQL